LAQSRGDGHRSLVTPERVLSEYNEDLLLNSRCYWVKLQDTSLSQSCFNYDFIPTLNSYWNLIMHEKKDEFFYLHLRIIFRILFEIRFRLALSIWLGAQFCYIYKKWTLGATVVAKDCLFLQEKYFVE